MNTTYGEVQSGDSLSSRDRYRLHKISAVATEMVKAADVNAAFQGDRVTRADIPEYKKLSSYKMVTNVMLLANIALARTAEQNDLPFIYRARLMQGMPAFYSTNPNIHAGLNSYPYAHVTSPLRRLPDFLCNYNILGLIREGVGVFSEQGIKKILDVYSG